MKFQDDISMPHTYIHTDKPKPICPHFLAHLSRRLLGELIGYSVRRQSVRPSSFTMLKDLLLKTAGPIKDKFYVEPPWVGGMKVYSRHLGHMTKVAATPIYGKTLQKSSSPEPAGRFP